MDSIGSSSTSITVGLVGGERQQEMVSSGQHHESADEVSVINGSNLSDHTVLSSHLVTLRSLIGPVDEECPICRCLITDRAVTNTCRHGFDRECLESFIRKNESLRLLCPVCRTSFNEINHGIQSEASYQTIPVASLLSERRGSGSDRSEEDARAGLRGQLDEGNEILGSLRGGRGTSINATPIPQARVDSMTTTVQPFTSTTIVDPASSPGSTSVNVGSQSDTEEDETSAESVSTSLPSRVQLAQAESTVRRVSRATPRDFNPFPVYRATSRQAEGENRTEKRSQTPDSLPTRTPLSVQVQRRQEQRRGRRERAPKPPPRRRRERIVPTRAATSPRFEVVPRPEQPSTTVQRPRPSQRVRRLAGRLRTTSRTNIGGRNGVRPAAQRPTARPHARRRTDLRPTAPRPTDLRPTVLRPTDLRPTDLRPVTQPETETQSVSPLWDATRSPESDVSSWSVDGSVSESERPSSCRRFRSRTPHERRGGYDGRGHRFGPRVSNRRQVRLYLEGKPSK